LSIPKGQSATYNQNPSSQTPAEQIAALKQRSNGRA
jgi:hypothetical protein